MKTENYEAMTMSSLDRGAGAEESGIGAGLVVVVDDALKPVMACLLGDDGG